VGQSAVLTEFHFFGVLLAPIAIYALMALPLTLLLRFLLWWSGILKWFWHQALFEVALYASVLCLLVLYV